MASKVLYNDETYQGYSPFVAARGATWVAPEVSEWDAAISEWVPPGNATTVPPLRGFAAMTTQGTATARNVATTNALTRQKRLAFLSTTTQGTFASIRHAVAQFTMGGPGATVGGFLFQGIFGISDAAAVAGARMVYGIMSNTGALTNVEPSTLTNLIAVGHGAADTNLKLYFGGSAAQAPIDLGANFPSNTLSADSYRLTVWAPKDTTAAGYLAAWEVERLGTAFSSSGVITGAQGTVVPAAATLLTINSMRTNNATSLAVGMDFGRIRLAAL